ncbi:hypothetical protein QOT17_014371 [Balamuthia mandrillaris]
MPTAPHHHRLLQGGLALCFGLLLLFAVSFLFPPQPQVPTRAARLSPEAKRISAPSASPTPKPTTAPITTTTTTPKRAFKAPSPKRGETDAEGHQRFLATLKARAEAKKHNPSCVGRTDPVRLVVYSLPRSGGLYLLELLDDYLSLAWGGELFWQFRPVRSPTQSESILASLEQNGSFNFLIQNDRSMNPKPKHEDVQQQPWLLPRFKENGYSFILLQRLDLLAAFLSWETQQEHKDADWQCTTADCKERFQSLMIRPNRRSVLRYITKRESLIKAQRQLLNESGIAYITVTYEELTRNAPEEFCKLLQFLGCDCSQVDSMRSLFHKLHPKPKSSYFENWDDVVSVLKDTPYAWMLEA